MVLVYVVRLRYSLSMMVLYSIDDDALQSATQCAVYETAQVLRSALFMKLLEHLKIHAGLLTLAVIVTRVCWYAVSGYMLLYTVHTPSYYCVV